MTPNQLAPALLECWMRDYYFDTDFDLGSSGVEPFSMTELREFTGLTADETDAVVFRDSRTLGDDDLRAAIARRWGTGDPADVIVTHGSSEAISLVMHALIRPGDEVVIFDPIYQQLCALPEALGARIRPVTLRYEDGFRPAVEDIARLIGPATRLLVLNVPHNPTGMTLTAAEEDAIAERAAAHGAYILWDRAFADLLHASGASVRRTRAAHELSIGTLSKCYGLPGLRVGWCLADPSLLQAMAHLRDYTMLHLSPLVELVARRAIEAGDALLSLRAGLAAENLRLVDAWMDEHADLVEWVRPAGGVCGFPRLRQVADVEAFCHELARTARVMVVPGTCFGHPMHVRLGFGGATFALQEGLRRLSQALHRSAFARAV